MMQIKSIKVKVKYSRLTHHVLDIVIALAKLVCDMRGRTHNCSRA
jgi:hypothetical protein